ncbi:MAG: hypothetical protein QNI97_18495 [Desulfobacterales bacterium]|nr:hypothetical protein [Desulfobacterales bacterium]
MKACRECGHKVSEQAFHCPGCGAPYPAKAKWDGWGYEYKSESSFLGWPLVHISFKYRPNKVPVPARGIIAIGQFAVGVVNISQFGIGFFCLGQFAIGAYVLSQFALAYACIAQIGLYLNKGYGQVVKKIGELFIGS